jgi:Rrf2 family transcriptional regulator, nitric oxide-sensitive transcriptional repressor
MHITSYTDYSLRVLIHAAAKSPALVTIDEVAGAFRVSRNHLVKVIHGLAKAGFLSTTRGRNGGFTLARPAREIRVSEVVRLTEQGKPLVECFDPEHNTCIITPACKLKFILHDAEQAFYDVLSQRTIADLFISPEAILHHLGPDNIRDTATA